MAKHLAIVTYTAAGASGLSAGGGTARGAAAHTAAHTVAAGPETARG